MRMTALDRLELELEHIVDIQNLYKEINGKKIGSTIRKHLHGTERGAYTKDVGKKGSGNWGHKGRPGKVGGSAPEEYTYSKNPPVDMYGKPFTMCTYNLPPEEYAKVNEEICNIYHIRYKGKRICTHYTADEDGYYFYRFENHGYGNYNIFKKGNY